MRTIVPVQVRWTDLDAYGHVNNAAMFTLLEEARIALFWKGRDDAATQLATFVAHQEIEYLAPMGYPDDPVPIAVWISKIGGASAEVCYEVPNAQEVVAARARTTIVMVNPATGSPRRITDDERVAWDSLIDDPVQFRRS